MERLSNETKRGNEFNISNNSNELMKEACKENSLNMIKALYNHGAHITEKEFDILLYVNADMSSYNEEVIKFAVSIVDNITIEMAKELIKKIHFIKENIMDVFIARKIDIRDENDILFRTACEYNAINIVYYLINYGVNIHVCNDICLINAAKYGHIRVVRALVEAGANVNTALNESINKAYCGAHFYVVRYLYSKGAKLDLKMTPHRNDQLLREIIRGIAYDSDVKLIKELIQAGADLDKCYYKEAFKSIKRSGLCYNKEYKEIFLSLFEDSKIYRLMITMLR